MAETKIIEQSTPIYAELLGNGRIYRVPRFQRDYSWREEEWEDLWLDLCGIERGDEQSHFMGYIVWQSADRLNFTIIDGQQRFATLSILAMAVLKHLQELVEQGVEPQQNSARLELLRNQFLGYKDPATLIPTSKLFLNRNNDDFYQSVLLRLRQPPDVYSLKRSERLLWQAFEFFYRVINEHFSANLSGDSLARLLSETIEHILPEDLTAEWAKWFSAREHQAEVYRLGNLTLLETSKNKECGNAAYERKLPVYQTSVYRLSAQEINFIEWTPVTLLKRQERMAKWAAAVWRVDF